MNCTGYDEASQRVLWHSPFEIGIGDHVQQHFGHSEDEITVLHAVFLGLHVYMYRPRPDRPFWTLMTMGLSGYKMKVPERVGNPKHFQRCELMVYMPADWDPVPGFNMGPISATNWALYALKCIAEYTVVQEVWVSMWHGIPSITDFEHPGTPFLPDSLLNSTLLVPPVNEHLPPFKDEASGEIVNFWLIVPMTNDEWQLKKEEQAGALIPFLENGTLPLICEINRKSCLLGNPRDSRIRIEKDSFLNAYH